MNFGAETSFGFGSSGNGGGGGSTPTLQYGWVVGGNSNFATLPGSPTPPVAGASLTDAGLANMNVLVSRNGQVQSGYDPGNGNTFYTKASKASNTVSFTPATANGDEIVVQTEP